MGVDSKAVLTKEGLSPLDVMDFLEKLDYVTKVNITPSGLEDFCRINFDWLEEQRNLAVFYNSSCQCDYEHIWPYPAIYVSFGCWGFSDAIIMALVKEFGGFYQMNDCQDEWTKYEP